MASDTEDDRLKKLAQYVIEKGPERIYYIPDFITKGEEEYLKDSVYKAPKPRWTQLQNRRLQNWGGVPHVKGMIAEALPTWLQSTVAKISDLGVFGDKKANHVLVNEYLSGQGIMPHLDGPLFYPTITTVNLGSHGVLNFYRPMEETSQENALTEDWAQRLEFSLLLEPRSLLILQETCYHHFLHGIEERSSDIITDKIFNVDQCQGVKFNDELSRETRISLTIRHVPKTTKPILRLGR
ncbi:Alpha-ketoglutarate-dependent dioxygenase alkB 6 [Orchesella cincta]|uniref:Alpha-ketoglutarate-dependent dioxygenase alkB 6 n=1 Tax=Orchesella cincta TaxID=48709 RepID=A0A1D2MKT4_ORCCI|nr:Alpha-ketoglutarate-dependent dioxygenase alkB 6 [Orchesella cincta]